MKETPSENLKVESSDGRVHEFEPIGANSIRLFGEQVVVEYIRYTDNDENIKTLKLKGIKEFNIGDDADNNSVIVSIIEDKHSGKPNSFIFNREKKSN